MSGLRPGFSVGGGGSLPTASGAGQLPVSDGAGTAYTATARATVVQAALADDPAAARTAIGAVPTSRTVAGAALSGDITAATLRTALQVPPKAYLGPFSATATLGGNTGYVAPSLDKGTSIIFQFYKAGNLAGAAGIMAAHLDSGVTKGWDFGYDDVSGKLFIFLKGIASDAIIQLTGWDALSVGAHGIAINFVDDGGATGHLRWALDGTLQSNITANGTYVPPTTAETLWFGRHPAGTTSVALLADLAACRAYSTALSDADLQTGSTPAQSIPDLTGTVSFDLDVPRDVYPGYANCVTGAATARWTLTINGGLTRRIH